MAIKWKSWTAHRSAKVISFLLIPALVFAFFTSLYLSFYSIRNSDELMLLFVGSENGDYFFDQELAPAVAVASEIAMYGSEERIEVGRHLEWKQRDDGTVVVLDTMNGREYEYVDDPQLLEDGYMERDIFDWAMRQQLTYFADLLDELDGYGAKGLQYYISSSNARTIANVPWETAMDIEKMPAHAIYNSKWQATRNRTYFGYDIPQGTRIYLGYDQEYLDAAASEWRLIQADLWARIVPAFFIVIAGIFCFVVLMAGAGRRWNGEGIAFRAWDKPWLDISLALLIAMEFAFVLLDIEIYDSILSKYGNDAQFMVFFALASIYHVVPALVWSVSFAKRIKAGRFWRHTLVYSLLYGLVRLARLLWAGAGYAARAGAVAAAVCICGFAFFQYLRPYGAVFATLAALVGAMYYYKRLSQVKEGAEQAVHGIYDPPIPVTRGDLGAIAGSINNISAGINSAVEQRMKSERMKTELITNVSHDLRTPLTSMITYADLLKKEGLDCKKAPEYLDVLIQKSQRLKSLVDELFEAAKASTGNVEVNLEPLNLADLIRQCLGELDERVQESGLDFRLSLPEHANVLADGKLFWRVMENLLGNTFKYAMPGSRVYIDISEVADITGADGEYRLDVKNMSNHPLNMDPAELTERFTRGDSSRSGEGSGLGLSIVQSFVEAQGGRFQLSIDGDLFKATVFLPRCPQGIPAIRESAADSPEGDEALPAEEEADTVNAGP